MQRMISFQCYCQECVLIDFILHKGSNFTVKKRGGLCLVHTVLILQMNYTQVRRKRVEVVWEPSQEVQHLYVDIIPKCVMQIIMQYAKQDVQGVAELAQKVGSNPLYAEYLSPYVTMLLQVSLSSNGRSKQLISF